MGFRTGQGRLLEIGRRVQLLFVGARRIWMLSACYLAHMIGENVPSPLKFFATISGKAILSSHAPVPLTLARRANCNLAKLMAHKYY